MLRSIARALPRHAAFSSQLGSRAAPLSTVSWDPTKVTLKFNTDTPDLTLPNTWLRDHCPCPACIHPSTRQKLHASGDILANITPRSAILEAEGLRVEWEGDGKIPPHTSTYPAAWLRDNLTPEGRHTESVAEYLSPHPWKTSDIDEAALSYDYGEFMSSDSTLKEALLNLTRRGLCFVRGAPTTEITVEGIAQRIGPIRESFYGRTWDVRSEVNASNIAYTSLDLGLHMDLLYFEAPPGVQLLHSLENDVYGGESLFADALYAAETLRVEDPAAFKALREIPVQFKYRNDGHHLRFTRPTFTEGPNGLEVFYAPPFQGTIDLPNTDPVQAMSAYYAGMRSFQREISKHEGCFKTLLRPGDCVLFDNRRLLHGRTAFSPHHPGMPDKGGKRWLKGSYIDRDAVWDRLRVLAGGR